MTYEGIKKEQREKLWNNFVAFPCHLRSASMSPPWRLELNEKSCDRAMKILVIIPRKWDDDDRRNQKKGPRADDGATLKQKREILFDDLITQWDNKEPLKDFNLRNFTDYQHAPPVESGREKHGNLLLWQQWKLFQIFELEMFSTSGCPQ